MNVAITAATISPGGIAQVPNATIPQRANVAQDFATLLNLLLGLSDPAPQPGSNPKSSAEPAGKTQRPGDRKDDNQKDQGSMVVLAPTPLPLPLDKPPIQLIHTGGSPEAQNELPPSPTEDLRQPGGGQPAAPQVPVSTVTGAPAEKGMLAFAAQISEANGSPQAAPQTKSSELQPKGADAAQAVASNDVDGSAKQATAGQDREASAGHDRSAGLKSQSALEDKQPAKPAAKDQERQLEPVQADARVQKSATSNLESATASTVTETKTCPSRSAPATPDPTPTPKVISETDVNPAPRPQAAREISLRVPGGDSGSIDLKFTERNGKVQVAVRTPDTELAQSLQSNLGELVGRLEKRGFETETWTPVDRNVAPAAATTESSNTRDAGTSHQDSGAGYQPGQDGHPQGQNQRHRPQWMEELENFSVETPAGGLTL